MRSRAKNPTLSPTVTKNADRTILGQVYTCDNGLDLSNVVERCCIRRNAGPTAGEQCRVVLASDHLRRMQCPVLPVSRYTGALTAHVRALQ